MNPVLQQITTTGTFTGPDGKPVKAHSAIAPAEGALIQALIAEFRPTRCLEVGMAFGVSSLYLCDALATVPGSRLTILDPFQHDPSLWRGLGLHNLRAAGHADRIEFLEEPSETALPRLLADGRHFDFAFIDGSHRFDQVFVDTFYVHRLLRVGGCVVFDDADWPSVRKALRFVVRNLPYRVHASACPMRPRRPRRSRLQRLLARWPQPDSLPTDADLKLDARCLALIKTGAVRNQSSVNTLTDGGDNREYFEFQDF